jgi:hypothetical protein
MKVSERPPEKLEVIECDCGVSIALLSRDPLPRGWTPIPHLRGRAFMGSDGKPVRRFKYTYSCPTCSGPARRSSTGSTMKGAVGLGCPVGELRGGCEE